MAMGRAEAIYESTALPVAICDTNLKPRSHQAWLGNPAVEERSPYKIIDCPQNRPYIIRWEAGPRSVFRLTHRARAGHIVLTEAEQAWAERSVPKRPFAVVEPLVRIPSSVNKDWGINKWAEVIKDFPLQVIQCAMDESDILLKRTHTIFTSTFRLAAAVIARASLVLTIDGGTHHMAASMGTPAVVVFGGFANPLVTGYPYQRNFYSEIDGSPCGNYQLCGHCKQAMDLITPAAVRKAALDLLQTKDASEKRTD
jgi:Glycosyltransferase family 9 (heptosyltransferase)